MLKIFLTITIQIIFLPSFAGNIFIYVSPHGTGNGSAKEPTTLQKALAKIPALKKSIQRNFLHYHGFRNSFFLIPLFFGPSLF